MKPIVRFAPSPTGYLHIGGVRTALFNWLYAKHFGGQFLLRIEDTDRERSTPEAVNAIIESLRWLGLHHDGEIVFQSHRFERHAQIAHELVQKGLAYYCYCSPEDVEKMREDARSQGQTPRYNGFWRERDLSLAPPNVPPVVRFKALQEGETVIEDLVQGRVVLKNSQMDDLVLLRADGTPTYMLSVIVDDHDMNITHVIRGDDHLTNAFRQKQLYEALNWDVPQFAHIPLIHGPDGAKLSKRHGALGAEQYQEMGYLPEALLNYLLRLGWAHGDHEIISLQNAIEWFDLPAVGRSPARMDFMKLNHLNGHYIRHYDDNNQLCTLLEPFLVSIMQRDLQNVEKMRILKGLGGLKERAKTLLELAQGALIYTDMEQDYDEKAKGLCSDDAKRIAQELYTLLEHTDFTPEALEHAIRSYSLEKEIKMGPLSQVLRIALTKRTVSPSLFDIMHIMGKADSLRRLQAFYL